MHDNAHHLAHKQAQRKGVGDSHKVECNGGCRCKSHRQKGIHEYGVLRTAIAFGGSAKDIGAHIEQKRKGVPGEFLGNVGREGAHKNHRRAKNRNSCRNPEGFHDAVVSGAAVQAVLWQVPVQALVEPERCRVRNGQKEGLGRYKDSKFSGAKNTCHHESQKRTANLEDCPHDVYNHRLF